MNTISDLLLAWYDAHSRSLPWRGIANPYYTWISEIMLQQTRVDTVIPRYLHFIEHFPTVDSLAEASEAEVLKEWEGLGYYSRARNLLTGARQIMREYRGQFPSSPEALHCISGIGSYTAGAIASIAFQQQVPAVDGNVIRVLSRVFGIRENVGNAEIKKEIERTAASLVPLDRPGDYNQAVMDLGAMVCVPGTPNCDECPLRSVCNAYRAGDAADLPIRPASHPPKEIRYDVLLITCGDSVLMQKRTEQLLHGLWVFPMAETAPENPSGPEIPRELSGIPVSDPDLLGSARHVFTHQIWQMRVFSLNAASTEKAPKGYSWIHRDQLPTVPVPTAMKIPLRLLEAVPL